MNTSCDHSVLLGVHGVTNVGGHSDHIRKADGPALKKSCHQNRSYPDNPRAISQSMTTGRHPLNVKPSGNAYFSDVEFTPSKAQQMGSFSIFDDELLLTILTYIHDVLSLRNLSHTSRVMYAYLHDEDVWKKIYVSMLDKEKKEPKWFGSWHASALGIHHTKMANLQLPDNLVCSDLLYRPFQCSQIEYQKLFSKIIVEEQQYSEDSKAGILGTLPPGRIRRLDEKSVTQDLFDTRYHTAPFILTNSDESRWPRWNFAELEQRFSTVTFRQEAVAWTLDLYAKYLQHNHDENPLYLFDCNSPAMATLKREYRAPEIFTPDLFTLLNVKGSPENCRPDHAWLIVGPARSGSTFHKDPNYTSAWNAALCGRKLWVMLPPGITPPGVGTDTEESEVTSPVGIAEWVIAGFFNDCLRIPECQIGITFPGECMYVPSGWWHSVINLDDSVALTQNFVPHPKLAQALNFLKNKRGQLSGFHPHLFKMTLDHVLDNCLSADYSSENVNKLRDYRAKFANLELDADLLNEDCGEILAKHLPPMPVFELFVELLILDGQGNLLDEASEKLKKLERHTCVSETWEKLTETPSNGEGAFSFGFEESSGEDE